MKDENNNASDASKDSDTNVKLVKWLKDHTDPYKNPWSTNDWKQSDNILSLDNNDNKKIVIDPTANRWFRTFLCIASFIDVVLCISISEF